MSQLFNSSENYDVLMGQGVRAPTIELAPDQTLTLVMTHCEDHEPVFDIWRVAGRVCKDNCPECVDNTEVVRHWGALTDEKYTTTIAVPGTYYLHSVEAEWMQDPCRPVIIEAFIA